MQLNLKTKLYYPSSLGWTYVPSESPEKSQLVTVYPSRTHEDTKKHVKDCTLW